MDPLFGTIGKPCLDQPGGATWEKCHISFLKKNFISPKKESSLHVAPPDWTKWGIRVNYNGVLIDLLERTKKNMAFPIPLGPVDIKILSQKTSTTSHWLKSKFQSILKIKVWVKAQTMEKDTQLLKNVSSRVLRQMEVKMQLQASLAERAKRSQTVNLPSEQDAVGQSTHRVDNIVRYSTCREQFRQFQAISCQFNCRTVKCLFGHWMKKWFLAPILNSNLLRLLQPLMEPINRPLGHAFRENLRQ